MCVLYVCTYVMYATSAAALSAAAVAAVLDVYSAWFIGIGTGLRGQLGAIRLGWVALTAPCFAASIAEILALRDLSMSSM